MPLCSLLCGILYKQKTFYCLLLPVTKEKLFQQLISCYDVRDTVGSALGNSWFLLSCCRYFFSRGFILNFQVLDLQDFYSQIHVKFQSHHIPYWVPSRTYFKIKIYCWLTYLPIMAISGNQSLSC